MYIYESFTLSLLLLLLLLLVKHRVSIHFSFLLIFQAPKLRCHMFSEARLLEILIVNYLWKKSGKFTNI